MPNGGRPLAVSMTLVTAMTKDGTVVSLVEEIGAMSDVKSDAMIDEMIDETIEAMAMAVTNGDLKGEKMVLAIGTREMRYLARSRGLGVQINRPGTSWRSPIMGIERRSGIPPQKRIFL